MKEGRIRTFSGATAIVTGGASGIGKALCLQLAGQDCEVVLVDLQSDLAEEVVRDITRDGGRASFMKGDVSAFDFMDHVVKTTAQKSGRLDYIFNNAGIAIGLDVRDHSADDWNLMVDVNLKGVINGIHAAYPVMVDQGFGHVVSTASVGGLKPLPGAASYATTKAAVYALSRSLRLEAAEYGIRVSVLCPGVIRTPILFGGKYGKLPQGASEENLQKMWERIHPMDPDVFARKTLEAVAQNKAVIIIPAWWKVFWYLDRLSPALSMRINKQLYQDAKKELMSHRKGSHLNY